MLTEEVSTPAPATGAPGGRGPVPAGSRANSDFHGLFAHFANQVALSWRDRRIADVMRERAYDPSFGSIAVLRWAGLDLRNNPKFTFYGHVNVLRVEVTQLLDEAYRILGVRRPAGVVHVWQPGWFCASFHPAACSRW